MVRCPRLVVHLARSSMMANRAMVVAMLTWITASVDILVTHAIQRVLAVDLAWYTHLVVDILLVLDQLVAYHKRMAWYTHLVVDTQLAHQLVANHKRMAWYTHLVA